MRRTNTFDMLKSKVSTLSLPVVDILHNPKNQWAKLKASNNRYAFRKIDVDWQMYNPNDYLFTHCFVADTKILMGDGTQKNIQDIKVGDKIVSHTGLIRMVTDVMVRDYDGELIEMKVTGNPVITRVTDEHPFRIKKTHKTCACGCGESVPNWKIGKNFILGHQNKIFGRPQDENYESKLVSFQNDLDKLEWVESGKLQNGDRIALGKFTPNDISVSESFAKIFGYYLSEGWVNKELNKNCKLYGQIIGVSFAFSGDEQTTYVEDVKNLLRELTGKEATFCDRRPESNCIVVTIRDVEFAKQMLKYGGSGAQQKIIHPEVFQWKKELQRFVFACWYRGDAGSTISSNLVWGMNFIANTCQIPVNLTENPECTTKDGIFHQRSYYLQLRPGFMVDNAVEFGCVSGKPLAVTKRRVANDMVGGEMTSCLKKIIKLKLQEAIPVYNFSVEEDESYIANGLVVHNCSIVSSVATQPNGYRIIEPCDELVNANGNAWTNQVLPFCFKTFIGGYNFVEHVQIPELSKGCILDAVLRPVIHVGKNGKKATVLICDILVATERRFEDLISRIEGGSLSTLSMGALCNVAQCSYCGKIVKDNDENCNHIEKHLGDYIEDDTGVWKVAELVGAMDANGKYIEDSCIFIEASWVEQPAFEGAVMNYMINSPQFKSNLVMGEDSRLAMLFESEKTFKKLKVADKRSVMSIKITNDYFKDLKFANIVKKVALGK